MAVPSAAGKDGGGESQLTSEATAMKSEALQEKQLHQQQRVAEASLCRDPCCMLHALHYLCHASCRPHATHPWRKMLVRCEKEKESCANSRREWRAVTRVCTNVLCSFFMCLLCGVLHSDWRG